MNADFVSGLMALGAGRLPVFHFMAAAVIAASLASRLRAVAAMPGQAGTGSLLRFAILLNATLLLESLLLLPSGTSAAAPMLLVAMLLGSALWTAALGMAAQPAEGRLGSLSLLMPGLALALPLSLVAALADAGLSVSRGGLLLLGCLLPGAVAALLLQRGRGNLTLLAGTGLLLLAVLGSQALASPLGLPWSGGHDPAPGRGFGPWPAAAAAGLSTLLLRSAVEAWQQLRRRPARNRRWESLPDLANASFEGIALLQSGVVVDANAQLALLTGRPPAALVGLSVRQLFPQADVAWLQRLRAGEFPQGVTGRLAGGGGTLLEVEVIARRMDGGPRGRVALTCRDRSEALAAAHRIRHLSDHDPATGLPVRGHFLAALAGHMEQLQRDRRSARLLVLQVGALRSLHQVHGLQAEALVLREIAARLADAGPLALARLDGAGFALLLPPGPAADAAEIVALQGRLAAPYAVGDTEVKLDIHLGVARCPEDADTPEELLALADIAAERTGPGEGIAFVQAARDQAARQQRALEQDLRFATGLGQLRLHWQPQVAMDTGRLIGFEVLVRWQHPLHGMIPPDRFLPAAEANGVIQEIGSWVLRTAVLEAATWAVPLRVAVNVSPLQMLRAGFPEEVAQLLRESGLPPARLELEITESTLIEDKALVRSGMDALRRLGVQLAMDDFGTGYASIAMLRFFAFDTLKLDRSFLRDLESDAGARAILKAMIVLGRGLGMAVLVEGVETASQRDWLRAAGCDHGQGFLFGRPAPIGHWDGSWFPPSLDGAEQPQGQPGQQQEGREGQPPAVVGAAPRAAAQGTADQPGHQRRDQPQHQGERQFRRVQHGQHQSQLHVAAAQHAELPGRQQGERRDHGPAEILAFRPAPGPGPRDGGQQGEREPGQHQPVADAPRPEVLRDAEQRPAELGGQQQPARHAADASHAPPATEPAGSEAPRGGGGKTQAARVPPAPFTMERNPR